MPPAEASLNLDRILTAAEDVVRRFGPEKATVVDVARSLGVSHAAVYRHVATKAELRDRVVERWIEQTMPPLRLIVSQPGPAPARLKEFIDTLSATNPRRAAEDPELFSAYRALALEAKTAVAAHLQELIQLTAAIVRAGVEEGSLRASDPVASGRAVLIATSKFHHPLHAGEWLDPAQSQAYEDVWGLIMDGLRATTMPV